MNNLTFTIFVAVWLLCGCGGGGGGGAATGTTTTANTGVANPGGAPTVSVPVSSLVSNDDIYTTSRDVALFVNQNFGVLINDTGDTGTLSFDTSTTRGGTVRGYTLGGFLYTPPSGFIGSDTFTYLRSNGSETSVGNVIINVGANGGALSITFYNGSGQFGLVRPTDPQEFASYLQAQLAGGALSGSTFVSQADAIPNTRFALIADPNLFHATLARDYACQLAAAALGFDPLTAGGIEQGAQIYNQMSAETVLFLQVAAVFKGNLLGGPDNYDNAALRDLLLSKGLTQLANGSRVGDRDVPTLGAIGAAMNSGDLTMSEILSSGTFEDLERYDLVTEFVFSGQFRQLVQEYESADI